MRKILCDVCGEPAPDEFSERFSLKIRDTTYGTYVSLVEKNQTDEPRQVIDICTACITKALKNVMLNGDTGGKNE